ncbi:MAG: radical SAM protein [Candidatus Omnitrophica bacterium]|nr:radical SAM protein [Candidatus Omnitrophota bacterium]
MKKMKVMISYPPLEGKGCPLLGQNRQFQWFNSPTYIYPMVPSYAATILKEAGFDVVWDDAIAERLNFTQWLERVKKEKPDVLVIETKTPVVKQHWQIINKLKKLLTVNCQLLTVLMGDHVTAMPGETMENSDVDFVLTGGDYDFLLLNLCNYLNGAVPARNDKQLEPGIWYRQNGGVKNTGEFKLTHDLNKLPFIDRDLTKWHLYSNSKENGNYKRVPGTYTMVGRDCWYDRCSFCSWTTTYPEFRSRNPESLLKEIDSLIKNYNVREIMDDTGTFPKGEWLKEFCNGMIQRGYNKKIFLDCNMRFGAVDLEGYKLMKKSGFRLLLFGIESANQKTLERINKGVTVEKILESCKMARKAGLYPHITIMFGYPWEDYNDALNTLKLGEYLLKKGYAYTMQATMVIPYPGTPLFKECKESGLLKTLDWERYDMKEPVMKTDIEDTRLAELVQGLYKVAVNPEFIYNRLISIRDFEDVKYFFRAARKVAGHILDFKHG